MEHNFIIKPKLNSEILIGGNYYQHENIINKCTDNRSDKRWS